MDSDLVKALVTAGVWLGVVVAIRFALNLAYRRYERRLVESDRAVAARRRTTFAFLVRLVVVLVALIGTWNVLSIFPVTEEVARAFLASTAVLALVAGLALTTPLANLGSGLLLAFTQPVRLGDRVTVDGHTGVVERITISYTALLTDDGKNVFVPNRTMVSETLVNRSARDPRRSVAVQVPVRLGAPLTDARRVAEEAVAEPAETGRLALEVQIGEVTDKVVWLEVVALAPPGSDVAAIATELRERALDALAAAELLPAA